MKPYIAQNRFKLPFLNFRFYQIYPSLSPRVYLFFPFYITFVGFNPFCSQLFYLLAAADWWAYGSRCRHM